MIDSGWVIAIAAVVTIAGGVVAFLVRLQNKIDSKLGYAQHEKICQKSHAENMKLLSDLKEMIETNEKNARDERHEVRNSQHALAIKVEGIAAKVETIRMLTLRRNELP